MDNFNQYSQDIAKLHEYGYRAYEKAGNFRRVIQKGFDIVRLVPVGHNQLAGTWHALRAYQDAERKKGVPIQYNEVGPRKSYTVPEKTGESKFDFFDFWPVGDGYGPQAWQTHHISDAIKHPVARFTNFRWRAGYPKGGQNE